MQIPVERKKELIPVSNFVRLGTNFNRLKDIESIESKIENIILAEWNFIPRSFETMKKLALALLTFFGFSY